MKYKKRVFGMDEPELRAALELLVPERGDFAGADREAMQEELVNWWVAIVFKSK